MPGLEDDLVPVPALAEPEYTILKQRVDLDVDFAHQALKGSTEITLQPLVKDLKEVNLHCRQCRPTLIQAGGITARWEYDDPYRRARMPEKSTAEQHSMLKRKIQNSLGPLPQAELSITLPSKLKIQELRVDPATALPQYDGTPNLEKQETDAMAAVEAPTVQSAQQHGPQFAPIKIYIEFEVSRFRDGIHWIGVADGDARFPYMYTKAELDPGNTSCIFPCMDNATTRCMWEIAIKCPRTLGDAFRKPKDQLSREAEVNEAPGIADTTMVNGPEDLNKIAQQQKQKKDEYLINLTPADAALELSVLCVGELIDDITDSEDETRHTVLFNLSSAVTARHIGFAIGPFEHVDLAAFREADEEEKLGRSAVKIDAYCLPGRAEELRNTAYPVHLIIDYFGVMYGGFPFSDYQMLFVDDLASTTVPTAGLTFCNADMLFPYEVLDYLTANTKILIRAVADQWMGVNAIPKDSADAWIVAGIAGYMTDQFSKKLLGNNEYRWSQKLAADKVYELDVERPSLQQLGSLLHLDPTIREFVDLKSALVLAILDRRLIKASSSSGITRIINRIFLDVKTGKLNNGELSTNDFMRTCEKLGHNKLDSFFKQWVYFAGCPIFDVKQRFNKKKLVVEMTITQRQVERMTKPEFEPSNFMREIKEHVGEVWAPEVQPVFTGPMTVRIHEADGTPYEHIIDIKEQVTKLDIPYNTKYKRLKRSRRQKERALATAGGEDGTGGGDDSLLYCLGDILDTPQEVEDWKLKDWTAEEESMMGQESYEWIRMDADFEWIGKIHLQLPLYMYVSQLQQDRDLVAQYESVKYIQSCGTHQTSLSVLVRTLMDSRYFHGIRTIAADAIAVIAKNSLQEVGQYQLEKAFSEMFCVENTHMPRPNDWTNRINYILQCSLPQSMAKLRDADGKVPLPVRRFFIDKLKFNDNSTNEFSDAHYISMLMTCLADSLVVSHREAQTSYTFEFGEDEPMADDSNPDADFEKEAISEIERYRRIDEWISTYHNVYSTTAIECLQKLTQVGIVKDKIKELMEYTRVENAINVRLVAFNCLVETGVTRKMSMLAYLLSSLVEDRSPTFRRQLLDCFGVALGHIALGDDEPEPLHAPVVNDTGLVLEQEVNHEIRHLEATRKTSPEGALAALKNILQVQPKFKQALWDAVTSPTLTIDEIGALIDIAALVFDSKVSLGVTLRYPRHWRVVNDGHGKVRFIPHGAYRTAPTKGLPFEDWTYLQELKLQYNGPLDEEIVKKREAERQIAEMQKQLEQAQRLQAIEATRAAAAQQQQAAMPPPTSLPTPSAEKTSLKLSLGSGIKRKQSTSSTPREGSPKAQKIIRQQTPNGYSGSPVPRDSPSTSSAPKMRRGSTPASAAPTFKKSGRKIVKLRFNKASSASKIASMLSKAPRPRPRPTPSVNDQGSSANRSNTPVASQHSKPSNGTGPPGSLVSPSSFSASPSQAQSLNMGGFRSFGPSEPVETKPAERKEPAFESKYNSLSSAGKISKSAASSAAPSPTATTPGGGDGMAPPKKKFTLKLGGPKKT